MDIKKYNEMLDNLLIEVENNEINEDVLKKIDYLFDFKPISVKWHLINCKALMKQEKYSEVIGRYGDIISKEYNYENNAEIWNELIEAYAKTGQENESKRQAYMRSKLIQDELYSELDNKLNEIRQKFMDGDESKESIVALEDAYFQTSNLMMAFVIYLYGKSKYPELISVDKDEHYLNMDNMAYFYEYLEDKKEIVIIMDKGNSQDYDIMTYILHSLDIPVYMISDIIQEEGQYQLQDTVSISMENIVECEDCKLITAIEKTIDGESQGNNISYIIDYICKNNTKDDFAIVIGTGNDIEKLVSEPYISKRFSRLNQYEAVYLEEKVGFAWSGDYYTYISRIYNTDARELVEKEPEVDFSIVIPVRNATETLYYTLKTCLDQDYQGTYEVLVSDNSTEGNTVAREICERLNDDKIRYITTPRDLTLTKSFEYAYLQTRGEFIIPIGADDGILQWGLSTLKMILNEEKFKNHKLIQWIRGFYAWPGFNGGQENQFVIPLYSEKNKIKIIDQNAETLIRRCIDRSGEMYVLPNMYINSGFTRSYLTDLYEKTGELLNGSAQDIYMGVTNCAINKSVLTIEYPITVAGMSSASVGSICNGVSGKYDKSIEVKFATLVGGKGISMPVQGRISKKIFAHIRADVGGLYKGMDKLTRRNVLKIDLNELTDVKKMQSQCIKVMDSLGDKYMVNFLIGYEIVKSISDDYKKWYQNNIMNMLNNISYMPEEYIMARKKEKMFSEGYTIGGGITLDASRYDVENIYDAVNLYKKFIRF